MPNQGFRFDFKMMLEGIEVPFTSATVASTPGGTMANINIYSNKFAHDLLPKTSVQIFYKEWVPSKAQNWYIMFDGSISNVTENDSSVQGRMLAIEARDFVTDLNKIPAALVWDPMDDLKNYGGYSFSGVFTKTVVPNEAESDGTTEYATRVYTNPGGGLGSSGLLDLSEVVKWVSGGAQGGKKNNTVQGTSVYKTALSGTCSYYKGNTEGGLFLDSFARGIWMDSVGGTSMGAFLNKRLRADKKLVIPTNASGYNMFSQNQGNTQIGSYLMGNARFTSVAASIMRMSGMFSARLCNVGTPTAIYIGDDSNKNPAKACGFVIDERVREFLVKENKGFGGKYLLNEAMILPPLEFTTPPDCNLIFPAMYDNIYWRHDYDADMTRGMFTQADLFSSAESNSSIKAMNIQVPNALFDIHSKDEHGRKKPPLTLEERYKGVNPHYGNVSYKLGLDDAAESFTNGVLTPEASAALKNKINELNGFLDGVNNGVEDSADIPPAFKADLLAKIAAKESLIAGRLAGKDSRQTNAVQRHALIKFLNTKYNGRVMQVSMVFNPYIMAGFPSIIFAGENPGDKTVMKDMIGQVQQVQHNISITPAGADATTSVVLNGARFVSEPTDMDEGGNPIYAMRTDTKAASIDKNKMEHNDKGYTVNEGMASVQADINSNKYDLSKPEGLMHGYEFAKDLLGLSADDKAMGESNSQYLDEIYTPNKIAKFYTDSMGMKDSFMVGGDTSGNYWMYDTIHEATEAFKANNSYIYSDYSQCMKRVHRDICTADVFYGGVMGASVKEGDEYVVHSEQDQMQHGKIHSKYYGVSTELYDSGDIDELKKSNKGLLEGPGKCSSILESMPVTSFIQERRDQVAIYLNSVTSAKNHTKTEYRSN